MVNRINSYSMSGCTSAIPTLSHETSFAQTRCASGEWDWLRGAVMNGHVCPSVRARLVGVWQQMSDMLSFWIRPEYVVDYRPILDAPVDAAGEVVEEIMLYCCWCIRWCRTSAMIAMRCWWLVVALYFLQLLIFWNCLFLKSSLKIIERRNASIVGFLSLLAFYSAVRPR